MANKQIKVIRTHDEFYAEESSKLPVKETFIQTADLIERFKTNSSKNISIADIGCATGVFVNYLMNRFPEEKIVGYEYLASLIKSGEKTFPNIEINQASVLDRDSIAESDFDIITLMGVLSIFDDVEPVIANLIHWTKPNGKIYIHGMFNPNDIDVFLKYRKCENYGIPEYESGWNIISQKSIQNIFNNYGITDIKFHPFNLSINLEKHPIDPIRSWTERLPNGKNQVVNGLCIKQPQYILEASIIKK